MMLQLIPYYAAATGLFLLVASTIYTGMRLMDYVVNGDPEED